MLDSITVPVYSFKWMSLTLGEPLRLAWVERLRAGGMQTRMCMRRILSFSLFILLFSSVSSAATQQAIDAANREAGLLQQQEQQRQQHDRNQMEWELIPEGIDLDALVPKVTSKPSGICREIIDIHLSGASLMSLENRNQLTAPYVDRCLTASDIEHLLSDITAYYIHRGYIAARAYLAPQDLRKGQLEIIIVEGVISKILLEDGHKKSISLVTAFPCLEDGILNLRDIEQGMEQVNAVQSNHATMKILPGEKPGESIVMVHNEPTTRLHITLSADNEGSQSTGTGQAAASVILDRPLGLNDFVNVTHRQTHPTNWAEKMSRSDSILYWVPFGYNAFSYNYSISKYVSTIITPGNLALRSNGDNENFSGKVERTVYRDQSNHLKFSGALTVKDSNNYLADQFLGVSSRRLAVSDVVATYLTHVFGGSLTLTLDYAQGLNAMEALKDSPDTPAYAPKAQYGKITYGFDYNRSFMTGPLEGGFHSVLSVQRAFNPLYGSEQLLIGGIYTVRGFVNNTFSGDNGYSWQNDLSVKIPIQKSCLRGVFRPYIALDHGQVSSLYNNAPGGTLTGGAFGFELQLGVFDLEVFNSRPFDAPYFASREHSHTYVTLKLSN